MSTAVSQSAEQPLWQPSPDRVRASNVAAFIDQVNRACGTSIQDFPELQAWSVANRATFWAMVWDAAGIVAETRGETILADGDLMPGARFFPEARLSYAENLLSRRDDGDALVFWGEDRIKRRMNWRTLYDLVARLRQAMAAYGVGPGDRVAGFVPNMPETVAAMLAATSLGAVWSSCSPDFGVAGVLDRFGQIEPKLLVTADGYFYNGKMHDSLGRVQAFLAELPTVVATIVMPYVSVAPDVSGIPNGIALADAIAPYEATEISFVRVPFNHPLFILYSSGTTGKPKCIVHGVGGTLLQLRKEHLFHCDVKPDDRIFYFTTCGWMMWNWVTAGLASGATVLLFDGSPFHPDGNILWDFADAEGCTFFGTSAKYIDACNKAGLEPAKTHRLNTVRSIASTGSPLVPESFDYVYDKIKRDVQLASISGGTDIVSCFVLGNPIGPVWRGEIQTAGLGMAVDIVDDMRQPVRGERGELVCTRPFPSMPVGFWKDPDGHRYRGAYFERFPGIWHHGDFAERTDHGGFVIHGRSDAVLNPGGVRIGTAEIYRQVEQLPEIQESLVIGQAWEGDVRVVLFVKLREGLSLDDALIDRIKTQIRGNTTPRHVPAKICQVDDIPRTRSGKITELAVRDVVHGRPVKNQEALANPDVLSFFANRPEQRGEVTGIGANFGNNVTK